jgi:hypothetical protein
MSEHMRAVRRRASRLANTRMAHTVAHASLHPGRGMGPEAPSGFNYTQHNCNRPPRWGCGKRTLVGYVGGHYHHHRFRCKSYSCGRCGPRKVRQVRKRIVQLALV